MVKHQYRSRNDIIASILEVANGNRVRATEIQFKAYISYSILKEYLVLLLENDLLEYVEGERTLRPHRRECTSYIHIVRWAN